MNSMLRAVSAIAAVLQKTAFFILNAAEVYMGKTRQNKIAT